MWVNQKTDLPVVQPEEKRMEEVEELRPLPGGAPREATEMDVHGPTAAKKGNSTVRQSRTAREGLSFSDDCLSSGDLSGRRCSIPLQCRGNGDFELLSGLLAEVILCRKCGGSCRIVPDGIFHPCRGAGRSALSGAFCSGTVPDLPVCPLVRDWVRPAFLAMDHGAGAHSAPAAVRCLRHSLGPCRRSCLYLRHLGHTGQRQALLCCLRPRWTGPPAQGFFSGSLPGCFFSCSRSAAGQWGCSTLSGRNRAEEDGAKHGLTDTGFYGKLLNVAGRFLCYCGSAGRAAHS